MTFDEWWKRQNDRDQEWLEDYGYGYEAMRELAEVAWNAAVDNHGTRS